MSDSLVLEIVRQAITTAVVISLPMLAAGLIVGVIVSIVQTVTSIQDNILSFIPRAAAMIAVFAFTFPWMLRIVTGFTAALFHRLPDLGAMTSFDQIAQLAILLVRPGMLVIGAPFLGSVASPTITRIGLILLLAALLAPVVHVPGSLSTGAMSIIVLREAAIGLSLALAVRVLVFGAEFAGQFTGYSIGLSIGSLIDPQSGVRNNLFAILYANLTLVTIFASNAHHRVLRALFDSYTALPIGMGTLDPSLGGHVARMLGLVFVIGVRIAAPVVVVLLVVELSFGLIARVAPALNVMISGAPVRLAVGLLVAAATVAAVPQIITRYVPAVLNLASDTARAFR